MEFYLATLQGDPIEQRGSEQTILVRVFANRNQELYRPAMGARI